MVISPPSPNNARHVLGSGSAEARAQVGDETPLTAFRPDHILVALRGADPAAWQEQGLIDAVLEAFHVPVTVFEIDRAGHVPREDR
jgi:hypothetical protein